MSDIAVQTDETVTPPEVWLASKIIEEDPELSARLQAPPRQQPFLPPSERLKVTVGPHRAVVRVLPVAVVRPFQPPGPTDDEIAAGIREFVDEIGAFLNANVFSDATSWPSTPSNPGTPGTPPSPGSPASPGTPSTIVLSSDPDSSETD